MGLFLQGTWTRNMSMVIIRYMLMYQKTPIYYSHVMWTIHSMYEHFFQCDKLMFAYQKFKLCLPFFLLYPIVICHVFFISLKICWYSKDFSIENCCVCVDITKVELFSKIHEQDITMFLGLLLLIIDVSTNTNILLTLCEIIHFMYHHFSHDKWMATY